MKRIYSYNFAKDTSKELNYIKCELIQNFLKKIIKMVRKSDLGVSYNLFNKFYRYMNNFNPNKDS